MRDALEAGTRCGGGAAGLTDGSARCLCPHRPSPEGAVSAARGLRPSPSASSGRRERQAARGGPWGGGRRPAAPGLRRSPGKGRCSWCSWGPGHISR